MSKREVIKADEVIPAKKRPGRKSNDRSAYDWFPTFVTTLRATGNITRSCEQAGVSKQSYYNMREKRPDLAEEADEALDKAISALELEARDRALAGSDTMLIFLLKKLKPDVYGDRIGIEHSGQIDVEHGYVFTINIDGPSLGEGEDGTD